MACVRLVNRAMELIHPPLFISCMMAREELRGKPLTRKLVSKWESVFTAISTISNHTSKMHKDTGGEPGCYDFLLTVGNYSFASIQFQEIGIELLYNPGTAVAFCANIFKHGISEWGRGDRICYAFFNKQVVLERLGQNKAGWMTTSILETGEGSKSS